VPAQPAPLALLNFRKKERSLPRLPNGIFLSHSIGVKPVRFLFNWGGFNQGEILVFLISSGWNFYPVEFRK
jgi:hypothetical protein